MRSFGMMIILVILFEMVKVSGGFDVYYTAVLLFHHDSSLYDAGEHGCVGVSAHGAFTSNLLR